MVEHKFIEIWMGCMRILVNLHLLDKTYLNQYRIFGNEVCISTNRSGSFQQIFLHFLVSRSQSGKQCRENHTTYKTYIHKSGEK